jgi:hypothetical protein
MRRRECLKLIGGAAASPFLDRDVSRAAPATPRDFGISNITFGNSGRENALEFNRFLRAGGFREVTPTRAIVWWDSNLLHVEFWNTEPNPRYLGNPGLAKPVQYPGNRRFELSAYPDAVYVQYRPNWKDDRIFLFAADSSGASEGDGIGVHVNRSAGEWSAYFRIPWKLVDGRPTREPFGLNLVRSRNVLSL